MGWSDKVWALVAATPLAFAIACNGGGSTTTDAPPPPPQPESSTILIGEYGSLTGSEATFGQSTHNGVTLAIDEVNAAGGVNGKKLEVKVYDDQGKSQEAGTAVTRLITDDKVVAVLGEVASGLSIAGGRVAQQYGVPMISPSSTNAQVTEVGDMIFRVCFVDSFQGYVGAKFATENLKLTKAAVLYDQGQAYSKGLKDDFGKAFVSMGGTIVTEQAYTGGDQDFSAQLGSIREAGAELIYLPGYYTDVGNVALQARNLGITAPLLGGDGWDSSKLAEIGGSAIEGSYYSNHYAPQEARPEVKRFVDAYQARFHAVPDGLAALGYDATMVLVEAMKRSPSLGGKDLAAAIAATKDFPGVTGNITMDPDRNAQKPAVVVQMKAGTPTFVASVLPAGMEAPAPAEAPDEGKVGKGEKAKAADGDGEHGKAKAKAHP
ncbi:MAG: ABC transporter substrate-binding protein [Myxococcota bacterium]